MFAYLLARKNGIHVQKNDKMFRQIVYSGGEIIGRMMRSSPQVKRGEEDFTVIPAGVTTSVLKKCLILLFICK